MDFQEVQGAATLDKDGKGGPRAALFVCGVCSAATLRRLRNGPVALNDHVQKGSAGTPTARHTQMRRKLLLAAHILGPFAVSVAWFMVASVFWLLAIAGVYFAIVVSLESTRDAPPNDFLSGALEQAASVFQIIMVGYFTLGAWSAADLKALVPFGPSQAAGQGETDLSLSDALALVVGASAFAVLSVALKGHSRRLQQRT